MVKKRDPKKSLLNCPKTADQLGIVPLNPIFLRCQLTKSEETLVRFLSDGNRYNQIQILNLAYGYDATKETKDNYPTIANVVRAARAKLRPIGWDILCEFAVGKPIDYLLIMYPNFG